MDNVDRGHRVEETDPPPATAALDRFVDPVVGISSGTITYVNDAARERFDITAAGKAEPAAVFDSWATLEDAIDETTAGTARRVELEGASDARVHRDVTGATIVFEPESDDASPTDDRALKDRAINEAPVGITISNPDLDDNPLVYTNDAYEEMTGYSREEVIGRNCRLLQGEDSDEEAIAEMAAAIDEDRPVTVELKNYRKDGTEFWNEVTIAPVRDDSGEVTHYVGFQNEITARKEAELALEHRTEELEYVLDRVEGLIQDVTDAVAGSTDRSKLEAAVCDRIVEEPAYDAAWIGERNPAVGTLEVRESAGGSPEPIEVDADHPSAEAIRTESTAVDVRDGVTHAAFPLSYNGIEYGVLTVCAADDREIGDREAVILSALARTVASGVNARETSRVLATDAVVAVEVELKDPSVPAIAISAATDCRLEYRRSVHRTDDRTTSLFTVTGTDATADALTGALEDRPDIDCRVVVEREGECLVELTAEDDLVAWLSERGARVESIESEGRSARVTIEIPRSADVRALVEAIEARYTTTDVISFQQRERGGETRQEFAAQLEAELTDRQFAALQRAYLGGYFEWPRPTTGEELAKTMGVSRPTFHEHLRTAEAKLCRGFFGEG